MKVSLLLKWGLFGVPPLLVIHDGGVTFLRRDTLNARKPWHFFIISSQLLNIKQSSSQSQMRGPISCNRCAGGQLGCHQTRFLRGTENWIWGKSREPRLMWRKSKPWLCPLGLWAPKGWEASKQTQGCVGHMDPPLALSPCALSLFLLEPPGTRSHHPRNLLSLSLSAMTSKSPSLEGKFYFLFPQT